MPIISYLRCQLQSVWSEFLNNSQISLCDESLLDNDAFSHKQYKERGFLRSPPGLSKAGAALCILLTPAQQSLWGELHWLGEDVVKHH